MISLNVNSKLKMSQNKSAVNYMLREDNVVRTDSFYKINISFFTTLL